MKNYNDFNNPDKLESYDGPAAFFPNLVDERNTRKVMLKQFELIKKQNQEIIEQGKYREENRIAAKKSTRLLIISIIIAFAALIVSFISLFK